MYLEIPQGSKVDIQGLLCSIPQEGYVLNAITNKIEYRGIYKRSNIQSEQYWERFHLPNWYKDVSKKWDEYDEKKKPEDAPFYDERLEAYKNQEWDRRLNGFWFYNNGTPTYITGAHYMFLQWWLIDIGYPKFRVPDLEYFYFLQYCIEDTNCMGMLEITKRRFGKTFRGGLFLYDYVTRTKMTNAGIQSKTGQDAKKVFAKAVINPFVKLPKFFRPEYDMSGGLRPKSALVFQQTNVRGKKAEINMVKDELGSMIDHEDAALVAYDGQKLHRYFSDEWCKTLEVNIYDRHEVIRYCLMDDEGNIVGKALYSSTVEKLDTDKEGVQEAAKLLWDESDQLNKGENGRTPSGLYRFFMTADRAKNFDKYGYPNVALTIQQILADRETVKNNPNALAARTRKEARTIEEAWLSDNEKCIFNITHLNLREAQLIETPIPKRTLIFFRDFETQKVRIRDVDKKATDFYWEVSPDLPLDFDKSNKYIYDGRYKKPACTNIGAITVDSYSNSQGGRKYGSKASAWIGLRRDVFNMQHTGKAVAHLYGRPKVKDELHEQVMLAAEYLGFEAHYELIADDYEGYFRERGRLLYLGLTPYVFLDEQDRKNPNFVRLRGIPTTPFSLTQQHDAGISYVEYYYDLIDFPVLIPNLRNFDPYNRTKFDTAVSWLMLMAVLSEPMRKSTPKSTPIIQVYENNILMD